MAKSKGKEEVTEEVSWTVSATITASSDTNIESAVEAIEANLDSAAADVYGEFGATIDEYQVRMS